MVFFFKQKTAYEMRISDWSSDVCSSDLAAPRGEAEGVGVEQLAVVGVGLEHHLVDARVLLRIPGQAHVHARLQQGAEGLRQHSREASVDQALAVVCVVHRRAAAGVAAAGVERHQRMYADPQCATTTAPP